MHWKIQSLRIQGAAIGGTRMEMTSGTHATSVSGWRGATPAATRQKRIQSGPPMYTALKMVAPSPPTSLSRAEPAE